MIIKQYFLESYQMVKDNKYFNSYYLLVALERDCPHKRLLKISEEGWYRAYALLWYYPFLRLKGDDKMTEIECDTIISQIKK